eukprot:TRINITY_DN18329_c0_g1_i2.p2 TRINITY_DN18329_c0_g1~~TRINITY_DN18329_c0_g1_i2.p2  ORF type:complete len:132 (+),score=29.02 TRINITY_DN18329_c0_g1_i2:74-469(+)
MGNKGSRNAGKKFEAADGDAGAAAGASAGTTAPSGLPAVVDDYICSVAPIDDKHFAATGGDGWLYLLAWTNPGNLVACFRAHEKAANRVVPCAAARALFTASNDATVGPPSAALYQELCRTTPRRNSSRSG